MLFLNLKFKIENVSFRKTNLKFTKGFTLVEILIVVAILGVLSSIVAFTLIGHQKQARDAQRISDLAQIKRALQSAKNDCKGAAYYPALTPSATVTEAKQFYDNDGPPATTNSLMEYLSDTNLKYISSTFKDPKNSGNYIYRYAFATATLSVCPDATATHGLNTSGTTDFVLRTALEDTKNPNLKTSYSKCSGKFSSVTFSSDTPTDGDGDGIDDKYYYFECND